MRVDCAIYRDGRREEAAGDLSDALDELQASPGAFMWIGLFEPSAPEFDEVAAEFRLHPLAIEDAVEAHQRPKLEVYDGVLFLVLKAIAWDEPAGRLAMGEVMLFVGDRFVITVRHGQATPLGPIRHDLELHPEMLRHGPHAVLYAVTDAVVDDYEQVVGRLENEIEALEERVFSPGRHNHAAAVYGLKREVIAMRRAVHPLVEPMTRLAEGQGFQLAAAARPFFRDVADHTSRVRDAVEGFDDLLSSVLNANLAQVSVRQNDDMRRISAWVAIVAVPTMIAGIYGMNFEHMPELGWPLGYPLTLGVMAAVCLTLYRTFKRTGWL